MVKSKLLLLCFLLSNCFCLHAQENPFLGGWELTGIPADAGYSFQKYFDDKGEFFNTRTADDKVFNTHHGKYVIKTEVEYWELIAKDTDESMSHVASQTAHIYYLFSKDKKLLTLRADPVPGNFGWQETWKRIEVSKVAVKAGSDSRKGSQTTAR